MKYLLDTNVLIAMFKGDKDIRNTIMRVNPEECVISDLTLGELLVGAYKKKMPKFVEQVEMARQKFPTLPITIDVIDKYAQTRALLESQGLKLDTIDLLIGSTALFHDITVVTHNTKHFARIPEVKVEDWETE